MSTATDDTNEREELAAAAVSHRRGISTMWIVPLVALLIAGWLGYSTLRDRGPLVTITFLTADGLEAGKTKVKYRSVDVGLVETVTIGDDLRKIIVTARMDKSIEKHLGPDSAFWVVRPRLSAGGVSGLGTLISGAYIEFEPGAVVGHEPHVFTGLEEPPVIQSTVDGRRFILTSPDLNSVSQGSVVYYRGLAVGEVVGYELMKDHQSVRIFVFVRAPYDQLVRSGTGFFNASGIQATFNAGGLNVSTQSLQAILTGGIAFETPPEAMKAEQSAPDTVFPLFRDKTSLAAAAFTIKNKYLLYFDGSVRGLQPGATVEFRGIRVGTVVDLSLEVDADTGSVRIPVTIEIEPQRLTVIGRTPDDRLQAMQRFVSEGLRAQLRTDSLLTGALYVDLDLYPGEPPAEMKFSGQYPQLPTLPSFTEELRHSVTATLDRINRLPLEQVVNDTKETVATVRKLVEMPAVKAAVASLDQVGPLLVHVNEAVNKANATLVEADATLSATKSAVAPNSAIRQQLVSLLSELTEAARSLRVLADFLERHPEALIRGKIDER